MFQKSTQSKVLQPHLVTLNLDSVSSTLMDKDTQHMVKTPRCQTFKKEDLRNPTQKQVGFGRSNPHKQRMASLQRVRTDLKENLLDLDLCFEIQALEFCQTQQMTQRPHFVIRKRTTPSISSKGKRTATGSDESSVELQKESSVHKNETDLSCQKKDKMRGRSQSKHVLTCRIVNSKKLPFELKPQKQRRLRPNLEEKTLNISVILEQNQTEPLLSQQSFDNLCQFF